MVEIEVFARRAAALVAALVVGERLLGGNRLQISRHRMQIVVAEIAQAVVDRLLHRAERDALARRAAGLQGGRTPAPLQFPTP